MCSGVELQGTNWNGEKIVSIKCSTMQESEMIIVSHGHEMLAVHRREWNSLAAAWLCQYK